MSIYMSSGPASYSRKFPRSEYRKRISFLCNGITEIAESNEIGEGGMSLMTSKKLSVNAEVVVNFFSPEGGFFSLRGSIKNEIQMGNVWRYGLAFHQIDEALKQQLRAFIARSELKLKLSAC